MSIFTLVLIQVSLKYAFLGIFEFFVCYFSFTSFTVFLSWTYCWCGQNLVRMFYFWCVLYWGEEIPSFRHPFENCYTRPQPFLHSTNTYIQLFMCYHSSINISAEICQITRARITFWNEPIGFRTDHKSTDQFLNRSQDTDHKSTDHFLNPDHKSTDQFLNRSQEHGSVSEPFTRARISFWTDHKSTD